MIKIVACFSSDIAIKNRITVCDAEKFLDAL